MNYRWSYHDLPHSPAERGRPWPRFLRGLVWAVFATFLISVLVFLAMQLAPDPALRGY